MKLKIPSAIILAGFLAISVAAEETSPAPTEPPDEKKASYALGMNLGLQIKRIGADVDVDVIARAVNDVLQGKPTELQESDLRPIFKQEEAVERARISAKNKAEGEAFLAKNAHGQGITVLPDGLQYRVLEVGTGEIPKIDDTVIVNYRGNLLNGAEFDHRDHFQTQVAARLKGWQEALQLMKVGSRWQIFLPPSLAYGHEWKGNISPDATLIFEMELVSIEQRSEQPGGTAGGEGLVHLIPQDNPQSAPTNRVSSPVTDK